MKYKPNLIPDGVKLGALLTTVFGGMFVGAVKLTEAEEKEKAELKAKQLAGLRKFVEQVVDERMAGRVPSASAQKASASAFVGNTSSKERS